MKTVHIYIYIILLVLTSCQSNENNDLNNNVYIDYQKIPLSEHIIGSAEGMHLVDSFLIILDSKTDSLFHIINLKNMEWKEFGAKGQGPSEFLHPFHFHHQENGTLCVWDLFKSSMTTLYVNNIFKNKTLQQQNILSINDDRSTFSSLPTKYNTFISQGAYEDGMFKLLDHKGNLIKCFFEYPHKNREEKNIPAKTRALTYQGQMMASPSLNKFCFACIYAPIINFYNIHKDSIELIKSNKKGYPNYIFENESAMISSHNKAAYSQIYTTSKYVYALYSGKNWDEYKKDFLKSQKIEVYNWHGELEKTYTTSIPLTLICVTSDHKMIYAIADDPDPQLLVFILPNNNKIQ